MINLISGIKIRSLTIIFLLISFNATFAQGPVGNAAGNQVAVPNGTFTDFDLGYFEYLPLNYDFSDTEKKYPLILFFHGKGEFGDGSDVKPVNQRQTGLGKLLYGSNGSAIRSEDPPSLIANAGKHYDAIVISVQQLSGNASFVSADKAKAIYDWIKDHYPVDTDRVYLTGLSAGGVASVNFLAKYPEIPAAVLVHETASGNFNFLDKAKAREVPTWIHFNYKSFFNQNRGLIDDLADLPDGISFADGYPNPGWPVIGKPFIENEHYTTELIEGVGWKPYILDMPPGTNAPENNLIVTAWGRRFHGGWGEMYRSDLIFNWLYQQKRNQVPSISITGPEIVEVSLPLSTVEISMNATSSDQAPVDTYNWTKKTDNDLILSNQNTSTVSVENLSPGSFELTLKVVNVNGVSGEKKVTLNVLAETQLQANAGENSTVNFPVAELRGENSEGNIDQYEWTYINEYINQTHPVYINFTDNAINGTASLPWNNFSNGIATGSTLQDLADEQGNVTSYAIEMVESWDGIVSLGTPGGIYPDQVSKKFYFFDQDGQSRHIILSGLNDDMNYDLSFFNSATFGAPGQYTTEFSADGQTASLDPRQNVSVTADLNSVTPVNGMIDITISALADAASISALVIKPQNNPAPTPIIENLNQKNTNVRNLNEGKNLFRLTVTDTEGNQSSDTVEINYIVTNELQNIAVEKQVSQSSTPNPNGRGDAENAVDGNTDGVEWNGSISHTRWENNAWLEIDLGAIYDIENVTLWNRTDCCANRLSDFYILISDQPFVSKDLDETIIQSGVSNYFHEGVAGRSIDLLIKRTTSYSFMKII
ncbi:MAG: discoidin domain-containing protein, partial [Bacteroidota bacterium]